QGSCAHRFLGLVIETTKIKPAAILNQSIEVIATNLRAGKIDAAVLWEPSVSRIGDIVGEGFARIVATGHTFGISDAGAIAMREEKPFVFDQRVHKLLAETYVYLHQAKVIDVDKPAPGALDDSIARKVAQAAGVTLPLGIIKAQEVSKMPK